MKAIWLIEPQYLLKRERRWFFRCASVRLGLFSGDQGHQALVKVKRNIIFRILAILAVDYIISIFPFFRRHSESNRAVQALQGLPRERFDSAVQSLVAAQKAQGRPFSETVSLRELVAGRFLHTEDAAPFGGLDATLPLPLTRLILRKSLLACHYQTEL